MELNKQDILDWTKTRWHIYAETVLPNPARTLRLKVSGDQKYLVSVDKEAVHMGYDLDAAVDYFNALARNKEETVYELQYTQSEVVSVKIKAVNYEAAEQELKDWLTGESIEIPYVSSEMEECYYTVSGVAIV